jgi:hypothetical protein
VKTGVSESTPPKNWQRLLQDTFPVEVFRSSHGCNIDK